MMESQPAPTAPKGPQELDAHQLPSIEDDSPAPNQQAAVFESGDDQATQALKTAP